MTRHQHHCVWTQAGHQVLRTPKRWSRLVRLDETKPLSRTMTALLPRLILAEAPMQSGLQTKGMPLRFWRSRSATRRTATERDDLMWNRRKTLRRTSAMLLATALFGGSLRLATGVALADEPAPAGDASIRLGCTIHPDEAVASDNSGSPVAYDGERNDIVVDPVGQRASASSEARPASEAAGVVGEGCAVNGSFASALVVGAGSTGLANGSPVRLRLTVALDTTLSAEFSTSDPKFHIGTEMRAEAEVREQHETCDFGNYFCYDELARLTAFHQSQTYGFPPTWFDPNGAAEQGGRWGWDLRNNLTDPTQDYAQPFETVCVSWPGCADWTGPPPPLTEPSRAQTVEVETHVGAELTVDGGVSLFTSAYDDLDVVGRARIDDFRIALEPSAGYEGIEISSPGGDDKSGGGDNTPPTVAVGVAPEANPAGWHRDDATVTLTGADEDGGVSSITWSTTGAQATEATTVGGETATVVITAEGETTITSTVTDLAGNQSAPQTLTVRVDRTPPQVTPATVVPDANPDGWHTSEPTVTMAASDSLSGLADIRAGVAKGLPVSSATSPVSLTVTDEGETTVLWRATDVAGNVAEGQPVTVRLDGTAPLIRMAPVTVVAQPPPKGAPVPVHYQVDAIDTVDPDPLVSCTPISPGSTVYMPQRATCTATDAAGNTSASARGVLVVLPGVAAEPLQKLCAVLTTLEMIITTKLGDLTANLNAPDLYQLIRAALPCGGDVALPSGSTPRFAQAVIQQIRDVAEGWLSRAEAQIVGIILDNLGEADPKGGAKS
jgi:hypothetical protein